MRKAGYFDLSNIVFRINKSLTQVKEIGFLRA